MSNEIILITDFCNTSVKKLILKKLIQSFKGKYEICLTSHGVLPFDIIECVDFYLYDKKNTFIEDNSLKGIRYSNISDFQITFKSYYLPSSHIPAILRLWSSSISFLKNMGYEVVHILEYDSVVKSIDIFKNHKEKLDNYDVVFYEKNNNIVGNLFTLNLTNFELDLFKYDDKKIYETYKKIHSDSIVFSSENTIYDLIFKNKKVLRLNYQELEKYVDTGKCNILSENFLTKITFTFYKEQNNFMFFIHNSTNSEITFDLITNNNVFTNLKIAPNVWCIRKIDVTTIESARSFINGIKYFDIDFTDDKNTSLINDVKFIKL